MQIIPYHVKTDIVTDEGPLMIERRYSPERLREAIKASGLQQRWLAEQIGVHESLISKRLNGHPLYPIREEFVAAIAPYLRVPLDWLREPEQETADVT